MKTLELGELELMILKRIVQKEIRKLEKKDRYKTYGLNSSEYTEYCCLINLKKLIKDCT